MRWGSLATAAMVVALATTAGPVAAEPIEIGHIPECVELVPAAVSLPLAQEPETLHVRVLQDGVDSARAQEVFAVAAQSYAQLGITLERSFQSVSFTGTSAEGLIAQASDLFGGTRPAGVDAVYVLTSKDIQAVGSNAVAGMADCIGGVAFPDRGFAVGEVADPEQATLAGIVDVAGNLSAKIAAHELGHLLGGHHHLANCVEGLLSELGSELSPCTLMFNDATLASLAFGTVNGLVVRGHTEAYAG